TKMVLSAQQLVEKHNLNRVELLTTAIILVAYLQQSRAEPQANLALVLNHLSHAQWSLIAAQVKSLAARLRITPPNKSQIDTDHLPLLLLLAFPDRIGKQLGKQWKLSNGAGVVFHSSQVASKAELIVVTDFNASEYGQFISQYVELELDMVQRYAPELIEQKEVVLWSEQKQKPEKVSQAVIGELVLSEKVLPLELTSQNWQQLWLDRIEQLGWQALTYDDSLVVLLQKLNLVRQFEPNHDWPIWDKQQLLTSVVDWLPPYLSDIRNLKQLKAINIAKILFDSLDWNLQQTLVALCPETYQTPAGSQRKINYLSNEPKLSVKLQEMFGEPTTPTICNGKVLLTLELLSPAQRPLQLTKDLANFWQNAYQEVKKEMKGRYPKHPWPDDPTTFVATNKTKSQLAKPK
ncbi:MAG: hypothetical protein HWE10_06445, partial [Gammaproteobacteria bacterium]|nr:hypothetical protein [Gammaproteobacteria bacterium]